MKKLILIGLVFMSAYAKEATIKQLFNVQTVKVKSSLTAMSLKSYGFIKIDESKVYDVAPRFSGFVETLYADKLYKKVSKGEALVKVYSPEVLKAKDEYYNSVKYAKNKSMLKSAKGKLELLNIPKNELNKKRSNFTTIVSPEDGYIFEKSINHNSAFNAKTNIFKIVNIDTLWVEVKIHQDQFSKISKLDTFELTTPAYKQIFSGTNQGIYPIISEKDESFTLRLEVDNKKGLLKPGMYMSVNMSQAKKDYLTLPSTAIIRKNGTFYAFIVGEYEGEYEPIEVDLEVLNKDTYIIKSTLVEGDIVVDNALFMMDSDAQINGLY
ncbi:MAG: HlyD family efflux transporter periplasmic adaptor subunit [Helicobacteraceae bacterium]|nr:HlyD family efflux transporter periplasmic adaptor subunit [Helicobacteraceae bacterium]